VSSEAPRVRTEIKGPVAEVILSRGDKHNGLDLAMFEAIVEAGEALLDDKSVRAVVLHGEGKSFCAGLDFKWMMMAGEEGQEELLRRPPGRADNLAQRVAWIWQELPMPVIAAVHGTCVGGGFQIALGADIRIVHPESKLAIREMHYGIIPDMGITVTAPKVMRADIIKELTFTARSFSGLHSKDYGFATHLSDTPLDTARELARSIAARSPEGVRAAKAMLNRAPADDPVAAFALETELQRPLLRSPNQLEAVRAAMMKQEPKFTDPS
jgi:enoyl-CoA hydratase/carnithine racemase